MNYRQWKKNYKKIHGINPPLSMDKRKQYKVAKRAIKTIHRIDFAEVAARMAEAFAFAAADCMRIFGDMFSSTGMILRNAAENMYGSVDSKQLRQEIIKGWKGEADGRNHD